MLQCSNAIHDYITACILQRPFIFHPSELIYFGTEYDIPPLLGCGFTQLCEIPLIKIKKCHCLLMRSEVFATYIQVKTCLDKHCHMIAGEPPEMQHSNDCQDLVACSEDWQAIWWNGMGWLLLDARNPHSYDDALECFKSLWFGRVTEACKLYMFDNVIDTDLPAYIHLECDDKKLVLDAAEISKTSSSWTSIPWSLFCKKWYKISGHHPTDFLAFHPLHWRSFP